MESVDQQLKIRIAAQRKSSGKSLKKSVRISARHSLILLISTVVILNMGLILPEWAP